jgi:hypothetical protein
MPHNGKLVILNQLVSYSNIEYTSLIHDQLNLCWLLGSSAKGWEVKEDYHAILLSSHNFPGEA